MIDEEKLKHARTVNLPAFLEEEMGLTPVAIEGSGRFYLSPLGSEKTPSFHVSYKDGVWLWFDHRTAEKAGGDGIALLRRLGYSFKESVERLVGFSGYRDGACATQVKRMQQSRDISKDNLEGKTVKLEKALYAREFYARLPDSGSTVERYFTDRGLAYHPEIGARLYVDFKNSTKYLATPAPYPSEIRGIELREHFPAHMELSADFRKKRKCYGVKSLWVFKRDQSRLLVTESILDAIAGEKLFSMPEATLVALNGVGQAAEIERLLKYVTPKEVFVALDNDDSGREAGKIIKRILEKNGVNAVFPEFNGKDPLRAYMSRASDVEAKRS